MNGDIYSHGRCSVCKEQHAEENLTADDDGNMLCPTCHLEYEENKPV